MPESPPKRMTRARAKAVEQAKAPLKTTKITTAAAKASKTTTKRKSPADEAALDNPPAPVPTAPEDVEPVKRTRGRPKMAVSAADDTAASTGQKAKPAEASSVKVPKSTRGRPKKAAEVDASAVSSRKTTRAASVKPSKPAATKKKVTFQDEQQDKENRLPSPVGPKRSASTKSDGPATESTGLKAKPFRKPAATRVTRRGKKAPVDEDGDEAPKDAPKPLSPKKDKQIATASSTGSDDELSGNKTPIKPLQRSPVKGSVLGTAKREGVKLDFTTSTTVVGARPRSADSASPTKAFSPSVLASPARRPPHSPFKDALKDSPRRINLGDSLFSQASLKPTPASPFRLEMKPAASPLKASLLQSPARRPATSPVKSTSAPLFGGMNVSTVRHPVPSPVKSTPAATFEEPDVQRTSTFAATRSPERSVKVHKMTLAESDGQSVPSPAKLSFIQEPAACSPSKDTIVTATPARMDFNDITKGSTTPTEIPTATRSPSLLPVDAEESIKLTWPSKEATPRPGQTLEDTSSVAQSFTPQAGLLVRVQASFDVGSPATQYPSDDSESEDELQTAKAEYSPTRVSQRRMSAKEYQSRSTPKTTTLQPTSESTMKRQAGQGNLFSQPNDPSMVAQQARVASMTPLVRQLENWKASSPAKLEPQVQQPQVVESGQLFGLDPVQSSSRAARQSLAIGMTPLAKQLEMWKASSPTKVEVQEQQPPTRSVSSNASTPSQPEGSTPVGSPDASPCKYTFFDDEMSVRQADAESTANGGVEDDIISTIQTEVSEASQEYGDENTMPIDPILLTADHQPRGRTATCTPTRVFPQGPRVIHTVAKVPLRGAAEDSPCHRPMRRSNSLSGPISARKALQSTSLSRSNTVISYSHEEPTAKDCDASDMLTEDYVTPTKPQINSHQTPASVAWSTFGTPAQTPRRNVNPLTLKGAVVYVDVHTTEGADASGIFVELLTQMGARCVKQWPWNPNAQSNSPPETPGFGLGGSEEGIREVEAQGTPGAAASGTSANKIGITHVVYKDGGKRTLEKVRESNGVVLCVGVGWVLDCEREGRWLDETVYTIDTSLVPRGGQRRRKSMEPRALSNLNGQLVPALEPPKEQSTTPVSPTREFLTFSSPARRESTLFVPCTVPTTPSMASRPKMGVEADITPFSPSTPYFLHPAQIVQRTCPPKQQTNPGRFFPISGRIDDQPDESVRMRLMMARRKSLQWAPKVGSPLGKGVTQGI